MDQYTVISMRPEMTKIIRKYFEKRHSKTSCILMILLGGMLAVMGLKSYYKSGTYVMLFGLLFVGIGIKWLLKDNFEGETEADKAKRALVKILRDRGMEKLNVVKEQINDIEPILLIGFGASPNSSFQRAQLYEVSGVGAVKKLVTWIKVLLRKEKKEYDPKEAIMVGSDEQPRSLLVEVSLYCMTEDEILLYVGDVDISTGRIYREVTSECFYQDIESMKFSQHAYKIFHIARKRYVNSMKESFVLYMGGSSFSSSIDSKHRNSLLDKKFTAMHNLIRDKKNV